LGVFVGGGGVLVGLGCGVFVGGASVGGMAVSVAGTSVGGASVGGKGVAVGGGSVGGATVSVGGISVGTVVGSGVSVGKGMAVGVWVLVNSGRGVLVGVAVTLDTPPLPIVQLNSSNAKITIKPLNISIRFLMQQRSSKENCLPVQSSNNTHPAARSVRYATRNMHYAPRFTRRAAPPPLGSRTV
jgi:hypothetical protein